LLSSVSPLGSHARATCTVFAAHAAKSGAALQPSASARYAPRQRAKRGIPAALEAREQEGVVLVAWPAQLQVRHARCAPQPHTRTQGNTGQCQPRPHAQPAGATLGGPCARATACRPEAAPAPPHPASAGPLAAAGWSAPAPSRPPGPQPRCRSAWRAGRRRTDGREAGDVAGRRAQGRRARGMGRGECGSAGGGGGWAAPRTSWERGAGRSDPCRSGRRGCGAPQGAVRQPAAEARPRVARLRRHHCVEVAQRLRGVARGLRGRQGRAAAAGREGSCRRRAAKGVGRGARGAEGEHRHCDCDCENSPGRPWPARAQTRAAPASAPPLAAAPSPRGRARRSARAPRPAGTWRGARQAQDLAGIRIWRGSGSGGDQDLAGIRIWRGSGSGGARDRRRIGTRYGQAGGWGWGLVAANGGAHCVASIRRAAVPGGWQHCTPVQPPQQPRAWAAPEGGTARRAAHK
jgi:hypothetical protein